MIRQAKLIITVVSLLFSIVVTGKDITNSNTALKVSFLGNKLAPGKLTPFTHIQKTDSLLKEVHASYFLGYNSEYLYIYIEADGDSLVLRDRGYQNGDGFHLTIGKPGADGAESREFYVLGFSAKDGWSRKMSWYYNMDLRMGALGDDVKFRTFVREGKICFEAQIPWNTIKPYHPQIGGKIGFNLCFVKALNDFDKVYSYIVPDNKMQSEQSVRKYTLIDFETPDSPCKSYSLPQKHNFRSGDDLIVNIAGYSGIAEQYRYNLFVENEEKTIIKEKEFYVNNQKGEFRRQLSLRKIDLAPGDYYLRLIENNKQIGLHKITIVEQIDFEEVIKKVESANGSFSSGVISSLKFRISETKQELSRLKEYESCGKINSSIAEIRKAVSIIQSGADPFENKRGTYRRAYTSHLDGDLKPYSVYVPEGYNKNQKYPLLVYLHGSGQDDRILERTRFIKEGYIVVAPNGRGVSNCYNTNESQQDIREAVDDVVREFSIDTAKIVLSGFSMGGYGVLRTFYENPFRYSAIAILSGHPDLANKMVAKNSLNFLEKENINAFSKVPVFIYHSKDDLNCPFALMKSFAENLRQINSNLTFREDESNGHGNMSQEAEKSYFLWLSNLFR